MARCPNCSYVLAHLKTGPKCKCAKCGRLFTKKEIDNREFRTWNQRQRKIDEEALRPQKRIRSKPKDKQQVKRCTPKLLPKKRIKLTEEELRLRHRERSRKYYYANREKKILQKKLWLQANKERYSIWKKGHRAKHSGLIRQQDRIEYWRKQHNSLILKELTT